MRSKSLTPVPPRQFLGRAGGAGRFIFVAFVPPHVAGPPARWFLVTVAAGCADWALDAGITAELLLMRHVLLREPQEVVASMARRRDRELGRPLVIGQLH